jgi:hypothetical protein
VNIEKRLVSFAFASESKVWSLRSEKEGKGVAIDPVYRQAGPLSVTSGVCLLRAMRFGVKPLEFVVWRKRDRGLFLIIDNGLYIKSSGFLSTNFSVYN